MHQGKLVNWDNLHTKTKTEWEGSLTLKTSCPHNLPDFQPDKKVVFSKKKGPRRETKKNVKKTTTKSLFRNYNEFTYLGRGLHSSSPHLKKSTLNPNLMSHPM